MHKSISSFEMFLDILSLVYIVLFALFSLPIILLFFAWFVFLTQRLFGYRSQYNSLVNNFTYNSGEFNIHVFNLRVKLVVYIILILIILTEFSSSLGYGLGLVSFNFVRFPLNIELNCSTDYGYVWEYELAHPHIAFLMTLGDVSMCMTCVLIISLLKFIFLAYQLKTNFRSVKIFLIKSCAVLLFLLIISIIPQTQVFSKIITPILCITIIYLLFKHRAGYFHILRKRCNDTFGDIDHKIHLKTRRNSIITFNIFLSAYIIFLVALITDRLLAFICMIFTEQSRFLTAVYNLDMNLAFLPCDYQQILYQIQSIVATIQPGVIFIAYLLYLMPLYAVMFALAGSYLYRQCRGIDSRYIRFEGHSSLN